MDVRVALWFAGIGLIVSVILSLLVTWRGQPNPGQLELIVRGIVAFAPYGVGAALFFWPIVRPLKGFPAPKVSKGITSSRRSGLTAIARPR